MHVEMGDPEEGDGAGAGEVVRAPAQPETSMRLHGRAAELTSLTDVVARAEKGRGGVAFVEGEGGIGKTRLLAEILGGAEQQGFQVFYGRCEQLERMRPFGPLATALACGRDSPDARRAGIARLVAPAVDEVGGLATAGTLEYRAVEAFVDLVEHLCGAGPVAVVLEDLHWADLATLVTTRLLARRAPALPVAILATLRPLPATPELASLVASCVEEGGLHLRLGPLTPAPVHDLASEVLGAPPGPRLCQQLAGAAGNPLFVMELARALVKDDCVTVTAGYAEVERAQTPPTLRLVILRRLGALSQATLDLLRLGAVLGPSFSPADLATVLGRPVNALIGALDEALRAGVLADAGARLCFRHDLVHEALYGELPTSVRAGLHRDVAHALSNAGTSALDVAQHLLLGASPGDRQAVAWLRQAADEAVSRSPAMAAELLAGAVDISDSSSPNHDTVVTEWIMALLWSGRVVESEALAAELLGRAHDPAVTGAVSLARARALFILGRIAEGLGVLDAGEAGCASTPAERVQLQADRAYGYAMSGRLEEAQELAQVAQEAAEVASEDLAWCVATSAASLVAFFGGRIDEAVDLAAAAVDRAEASPSPLARRYPVHYFLAVFLVEADRFTDVDEVIVSGRRMNQEWGTTWVLPMLEWVAAARRFLTGDWDDAVAAAEAGLAMAGEQGLRQGREAAQGLAGLVAAYRQGTPCTGLDVRVVPQQPLAASPSDVLAGLAGITEGLRAETHGRPDQALAMLEKSWQAATAAGAAVDHRLLGPELVRLALAAGEVERAREVADAVEQVAARMGTAGAQGAALRCRGLLDANPEGLLASAVAYARAGRILERAFALEDAGTVLATSGRHADAVTNLEHAVGIYEALGASVVLARAEARLRSFGVRRRRRRPPRPRQGWGSVTASEQRVVELVARGLTNVQIAEALFVSRHTVESHVSHVFAKLGIASRAELAARAVARGTGLSWSYQLLEQAQAPEPTNEGHGGMGVASDATRHRVIHVQPQT